MTDDENLLADIIDWPDSDSARAESERFAVHPGWGRLAGLAKWAAAVQQQSPARRFLRPKLVIFAGDHGLAEADISAHEPGYTAAQLAALRDGSSPINRLAELSRVGLRVVDVSSTRRSGDGTAASPDQSWIRDASGRADLEDALDADQTRRALQLGADIADAEIEAGTDLLLLGDVGRGSTAVAAVIVSVLAGAEPLKCIGRGSGVDDEGWMRKMTVVRDARLRAWPQRHEPAELLRVTGGADFAAMTGFLHRAAARRTPVLLDGLVSAAAGMLVQRADPVAVQWFHAAQRSSEAGHALALTRLGLTPILELGLATGQGAGALLAFELLQASLSVQR
ncbi:nicotinate-nucleotide-dimethylbenzimidazole phosphoribosyltransferase [Jatrophihabitans sp. GAS493]|uniref:nicotinate-nucleotide--dimethylbenzimidazole phosphoribosyltransferase n=1 Tax=Jatrophihabitans sp. GAS493 TaxID=1907575 RepID=UPI000BBFC805|nr:nicotinate-nucleotide--dimethylbenzimidazole phosphoribosyltransferase [Jatrophihabitans sp. GAS493]SOD74404.1 nicotinate-nucleotide-dimethylbenzimidazole phosphoribosyltransferase [Jatrophihabitans sp. GAS493]